MKTIRYQYTVIYEPAEEGGYIARIPFLNDLTTQGETLEEAKLMAKDAIECYIGGFVQRGIINSNRMNYETNPIIWTRRNAIAISRSDS